MSNDVRYYFPRPLRRPAAPRFGFGANFLITKRPCFAPPDAREKQNLTLVWNTDTNNKDKEVLKIGVSHVLFGKQKINKLKNDPN